MINTTVMKFARLSILILLSVALTSCQTWKSLKNSNLMYPFKFLDQTGSAIFNWLGENDLPTDGKPATMQERARQIESRGSYVGKVPAAAASSHQRTASR